jgi:hypothetical protein
MLVSGNGLADIGGATVSVDSTLGRPATVASGWRIRPKLSVGGRPGSKGSTAGRMTAGRSTWAATSPRPGSRVPSASPSGTHLTHFRNFDLVPGNPSVVPVTISLSNTFASTFRNLLVDEEVSATMLTHTVVTGSLTKPEFATLTGGTLEVGGDLTASGALNGIIDFDTVMVAGVFTPNLSSQDYRITTLIMTGAAQTLPSFRTTPPSWCAATRSSRAAPTCWACSSGTGWRTRAGTFSRRVDGDARPGPCAWPAAACSSAAMRSSGRQHGRPADRRVLDRRRTDPDGRELGVVVRRVGRARRSSPTSTSGARLRNG